MKDYLTLVVLVIMTGCAQLLDVQSKGEEKAAQAIAEYCKNTDAEFRAKFRAGVNAKAAPNKAEITCAQ